MFRKLFNPNIKILALPVIVIIAVTFLSVIIFRAGYPVITSLLNQVRESKNTETTLEGRLRILKEFDAGLKDSSEIAFIVLPNKNPGAWMLAQIRELSLANSLQLTGVEFKKAGEGPQEAIKKMDINADFESNDFAPVADFLLAIADVAPISTIEEVEIKGEAGVIVTTLKSNIYWAALPETLPALSEPLKVLTQSELDILNKILTYKLPQFTTLSPQPQQGRVNPFN